MAKRKSYAIAQGQQGAYSGVEPGIPFWVMADGGATATQGSIPATAFPFEKAIWVVPDRVVPDAFGGATGFPAAGTYNDVNPAANEPALRAAIDRVILSFNAAFAAAAASFLVSLKRRDSTGAAVGALQTLLDGTVTTIVAFSRIVIIPAAASVFRAMNVGDTVSIVITVQGAGAACPAFGGTLDLQM